MKFLSGLVDLTLLLTALSLWLAVAIMEVP